MSPTSNTLARRKCAPCEGGARPLDAARIRELRPSLDGGWQVSKGKLLEKAFTFKDFRAALSFTNRVGELAEKQGHHPDVFLAWGKVKLTIWTHSIGGLSENDFILAAKIDALPQP
ncbi:MAG: 4a-hydroxytetrahydrobiopterin dehydratase [Elusimicrobiota bacterium]